MIVQPFRWQANAVLTVHVDGLIQPIGASKEASVQI